MSKNPTRVLVALLVLFTLTAGAAQAAPWSFGEPEPSPSFAKALWEWIVELLEGTTTGESGCGMDPNGCPGVTTDEGPSMDPNG